MVKKYVEHLSFIKVLANARSNAQRRNLLKYASRQEILAISEIFINYLLGILKFSSSENYRLYFKFKQLFRVIGFAGRKSWLKRKQAAIDLGKILSIFLKESLLNLTKS
jgi:hypothetical protein